MTVALRDSIKITTKSPRKVFELTATSPGGEVTMGVFADQFVTISETTRKGRLKREVVVNREDVQIVERFYS